MREIAQFGEASEAQIALGYLRAQGIAAEITDYHTLSARPDLTYGGNYFRLLVPDSQVHEAEKALEHTRRPVRKIVCPACQSAKVTQRALPLARLLPGLVRAFFEPRTPLTENRCHNCGTVWKDKTDEPQPEL